MKINNLFIKKIFKSFLQNLTGSGINTISSILSGYFFALFLGPAIYGVWQTARVFTSYGTFTSLGIPFVMRRDFITLRSEGKTEQADRMARVAMSYNFLINPVIAVAFILIAINSSGGIAFKISLILVGVLYITDLFSGIGNIIHKGFNDYKTLAIGDIINGIGTLIIIPFVYFYGYYALLIGVLILSIFKSIYFFLKRPIKYNWLWDYPLLKKMILTAFPIFLLTIISTLFGTIDRLIIAGMLNFENVGLYSLSTFIAQPITLLLSSFSVVLFTHLNQQYGNSKENHVVRKHVELPQQFFSNILPPLIGMGIIALPLLTEVFLPKYSDGIVAAQINIFAILFIKIASFSANGLFVLDKQKYSALAFIIAGIIKTVGSFLGIKLGYGIESVALSSVIAYFFYNAIMLYFVNLHMGNSSKSFILTLLQNLVSPITILFYCLIYVNYHQNIFGMTGISNEWLQLFVGEFLLLIFGSYFIIKGYNLFAHFIKK
jgi:O-antigen/teichoic acid export membrane protein